MPAAVNITPGARMVRKDAEHEMQATLSGAVVASQQLDQPMPPRFAACTAPTDTASGPQAGLELAFSVPELPEATADRKPDARALEKLMASGSEGPVEVDVPPPAHQLKA